MNTSLNKYSSSLPKLYQYAHWELPAANVVLSYSLLSLSGYKEVIQQKHSTIPHLIGLSYQADCILLDETFHRLLIAEHDKLCEYHSLENIQKREEKLDKAIALNDHETIEAMEYEDELRESKSIEIELDKNSCERRKLDLTNHLFLNINQFKHGDIIQFRNERLQFSFYVYQAKKGTFQQLLNIFKEYLKRIIEQNGIVNDDSISNYQFPSTNDCELILIPSLESDGYGIPSLFNDAPLHYFQHLSSSRMYRWIYLELLDQSVPIYDLVQNDIQLKKQNPIYRTLVSEDGEEMTIEDINSFPNGYVLIYDEVKTKLNIEWRKIGTNDYCNQYSSMYLLTRWIQQLQHDKN